MKRTRPALTSLPLSPEEDRKRRMIKYSVTMGVRILCFFCVFFVPGWWAIIPALGAIFLPYFAVVIANVANTGSQANVQRPGAILPVADPPNNEREKPGE